MNTKTLKTINFEDLKGDSHLIEYVDNNIRQRRLFGIQDQNAMQNQLLHDGFLH